MLRLLETLVLPPLGPILLGLLGLLIASRKRRLGIGLMVAALLALSASSLPWVGAWLLTTLQSSPPLPADGALPAAQAIVVLSAEMDVAAPEFGAQSPGPMTLQRLRYAAALQRRSGLPLLVSGGELPRHEESHAASMRRSLEQDFQVQTQWVEDRSLDTWENAHHSAEILRAAGVRRVLLVSHAWHMPRATDAFTTAGLEVVPAPTGFATLPDDPQVAWLPRWSGLRDTCLGLHEWLGRAYYALRR